MSKVYYGCAVRGGLFDRSHVRACIEIMKRFGLLVLTEHLGNDPKEIDQAYGSDQQIYADDQRKLTDAQLAVFDITAPSTGTGFMIARALELKKHVLCIHFDPENKEPAISAMINGCPKILTCYYRDLAEFQMRFGAFVMQHFSPFNVVLSGPPGSGKSTAGQNLANKLNKVHVSTGQICRDLIRDVNSSWGQQIKKYVDAGALIPADLMCRIVVDRLTQPDCVNRGFVLDGYPPSIGDLQNLIEWKIRIDLIFVFEVNDEIAVDRQVGRGARITDTREIALERVRTFHAQIPDFQKLSPTIFGDTPVVHVNAEQSADYVLNYLVSTVRNWTERQVNSFFPVIPWSPSDEKSTRFHFHIDGDNVTALRRLLARIMCQHPESHGQIKLYPITDLHLGPQVARSDDGYTDVYGNMMNFHEIVDAVTEAFVTGRMGHQFDPEFYRAVLNAIREDGGKFMTEVEQYLWEGRVEDGEPITDVTYDPRKYDGSSFSEFAPKLLRKIPPVEIHLAFDLPKTVTKLELSELMRLCTENGFCNGGWFIFGSESHYKYRANEFTELHPEKAKVEVENQAVILDRILRTECPDLKITVGWSVELVHAIYQF